MPQISSLKRAELNAWLLEFSERFARQPEGKKHILRYEQERAQGRENFAEAKRRVDSGDPSTDFILDHLLPHAATAPNLKRGAWVHVAPVVSGNVRSWFENAGWAEKRNWPEIAQLLFRFFSNVAADPNGIQKWCNEFAQHPLRKGFKAGFLSPMMNALHPIRFQIVNRKPLELVNWAYDEECTPSVENYARTCKLLTDLAGEIREPLQAAVGSAAPIGDALDMFAHWLVVSRKLRIDATEADIPPTGAVEEDAPSRSWIIATGHQAQAWPLFQEESCIAMDWGNTADFKTYASRDEIAAVMRKLSGAESDPINNSLAGWEFSREIRIGDLVIAKEGRGRLLGVGRVVGSYYFEKKAESFRHRIPVQWIKSGEWTLPSQGLPIKTLTKIESSDFEREVEEAMGGFNVPVIGSGRACWWMQFNPEYFDIEGKRDGHVELYTAVGESGRPRNLPEAFASVKPGDKVIGYSTSPRMRAAVLCEITKAKHTDRKQGEVIEFKRLRALKRAVSREELLADERFADFGALKNPRGSLFPLADAEYEAVLDLAEGDETTADDYSLEDAMADLFMPQDQVVAICDQLARKRNVVLQGPPGVGKTFVAKRLAWLLLGSKDRQRIEFVQFHPSMSYEDFVLGLRPDGKGNFALKPGIFHRFCRKAQGDPSRPYVFVIDEINRGNVAKIFGELLMLIEADKRGEDHAVPLAYGGEDDAKFYLPPNLHIIGTMNTADRSLALVDYALRRRFAFFTIEPDFGSAFRRHMRNVRKYPEASTERLCRRIGALNDVIRDDVRSLGSGYQIGHSFFCSGVEITEPEKWYRAVIEYEIRPLLAEYWMDDPTKAAAETAKLLAD